MTSQLSNVYFVPDEKVRNFIEGYDSIFKGKLRSYYNFSRVACLADFTDTVQREGVVTTKIAVVSGSSSDPEMSVLTYEALDTFQFDPIGNCFDLDTNWTVSKELFNFEGRYDLVLCSQVFEHIFSPVRGLQNLTKLVKPGGYIWVSVPTINCIHGDPYFYSAGYHPRFLSRLAREVGVQCIHVGGFGSEKYLAAAVLRRWLTHDQLKPGFRRGWDFAFPYLALKDGRKNDNTGKFISDSWALYRRPYT